MAIARRAFRTRRAGHAGTLDPFASGLLLLLVGRATRLAPYLSGLPKGYEGTLRLGEVTDTDDRTGRVLSTASWQGIGEAALRDAMQSLTGRYEQAPPVYSARKVAGERAYALARRGEAVALAPREVDVARFDFLRRDGADVAFRAHVSSGTYVRSLARDLGARLGCGAHLVALRRVGVGPHDVSEAVAVEDLRAGRASVRPPLDALRGVPRQELDAVSVERVRHGQSLERDDVPANGPVALLWQDELLAVAEARAGRLEPRVVLEG